MWQKELNTKRERAMGIDDLDKKLDEAKRHPQWSCRFHPTDSFHEVGCPHVEWTKEQLLDALVTFKSMNQVYQHELWGIPLNGQPKIGEQ